jgi:penicillin-binding protein 1C
MKLFLKRTWWLFPLLLAAAVFGLYRWLLADLPAPETLAQKLNIPSVRITDRNGKLLYEMLPQEGGRHTVIPLEKIPLALRQATIATEDAHFYQNPGVDFPGILRAVWINLRGGEALSGGSTITQQVARGLLMTPEEREQRSLLRKLRESILAWQLARIYPKDQVLALYLNQMYYGGLAYGAEAAAQTYFGKPAAELDLAEAALLAGLPQSPALYNPFTDLTAAQKRQKVVLGLMVKAGYITADTMELAAREPLRLASQPYPLEAPHFVMMVRSRLDQLFTPEQIYAAGGLTVRTTLDLDWQHEAERAVQQQLDHLRNSLDDPLGHNVSNAALVAIDPRSGEIRALVGSPDYFDGEHAGALNMALAPRQPGSALKPLIYAAAFDPAQLQPWTPATMILDVTTSFATHEGRVYTPENYDGREHGPVSARQALASSLNIPAVKTLDHLGLQALFSFASQAGITTLGDPETADLSIALGGGEVRLLDLTASYGAFATGGYRVDPVSILEVSGRSGQIFYTAPVLQRQRVMDARVAWLISSILSDDEARTIGFGLNSMLKLDRPAAVKTGTTTNFHDNWTVGYTPDLVVGVWAGNTSHEAMHNVTGLTGAAPIWHQFVRSVLAGQPEKPFLRPPGLVEVEVCTLSGLLPTPDCPYRRREWFIDGTQPTAKDTFYRTVEVDQSTGLLAGFGTPSERRVRTTVLDLPLQAIPWARSRGMKLLSDLELPAEAGAAPAAGSAPLRLVSPAVHAVYELSSVLPPEAQGLQLQALGAPGLTQVQLWVDGIRITSTATSPFEGWWQLSPGLHQAWAEGLLPDGSRVTSERVVFQVN